MGNLKDELIRKGVADDKRARQMAHEEKARRNKLGAEAVQAERQHREQEIVAKEHSRKETDRRREQERQREDAARAARAGVAQLLRDHALTRGVRGPRRFYFVTRDKKMPFLEVSEDAGKKLETGALAICEVPDATPETFVLVPAETAGRVRQSAPELVLCLNHGGPAGGS